MSGSRVVSGVNGSRALSVFSPYRPAGPSYRTRVDAWLTREGVEADLVGGDLGDPEGRYKRVSAFSAKYEAAARARALRPLHRVLVQKECTRLGSGRLENRVARASDVLIYDLDDAVYLGRPTTVGDRGRRARALLESADRVIAGSAVLAEEAQSIASDVRTIPTCIDLSDYITREHRSARPEGRVTVGWIGSGSTEAYLEPILPALARVQRARGIRIKVISAGKAGVQAIGDCTVERVRWQLATQARELANFDIGIVPAPNDRWSAGKCGYKLLQYGATGLPAVGSPVGILGEVLMTAGNPTAVSGSEWEEALVDLVDDIEQRGAAGERLRRFVGDRYTYDAWAEEWRSAVIG